MSKIIRLQQQLQQLHCMSILCATSNNNNNNNLNNNNNNNNNSRGKVFDISTLPLY